MCASPSLWQRFLLSIQTSCLSTNTPFCQKKNVCCRTMNRFRSGPFWNLLVAMLALYVTWWCCLSVCDAKEQKAQWVSEWWCSSTRRTTERATAYCIGCWFVLIKRQRNNRSQRSDKKQYCIRIPPPAAIYSNSILIVTSCFLPTAERMGLQQNVVGNNRRLLCTVVSLLLQQYVGLCDLSRHRSLSSSFEWWRQTVDGTT